MTTGRDYAFRARLATSHDEALATVTAALKAEGFGILTSVDMRATLREKLGVEFRSYSILGACNPPLAQRALSVDLEAGLVLPCSVVVYEEENSSMVSIADPMAMVGLLGNPALEPVAREAQDRLHRVLERLEGDAD
jgi:uncharacterized protein (DUF302 family)